jgi:hypothetical protein
MTTKLDVLADAALEAVILRKRGRRTLLRILRFVLRNREEVQFWRTAA